MKPLIAVTTYNKIGMTKKTAEWFMALNYDLLYVDDCSIDGTQQYLADIKVNAILKDERRGLTDSWNAAYKYWKGTDHTHLIICNNDILVPRGAVENMLNSYALTVPTTTRFGAGYACKEQGLYDIGEHQTQKLQDTISKCNQKFNLPFGVAKCWTGFCMCFSQRIIKKELKDGNLFDPSNINVGNDDDLARRVKARLALGAFVYHFKGVSFDGKIGGREKI